MTEVRKAAVVLEAGTEDYSVIMTMTSSMTTSVHSREATEAEFIAEMHKQYRIGQNTIGSKKKHQKIATRPLLLRCVIFKQLCYGYGQVGHNRNHCPNKKQGSAG